MEDDLYPSDEGMMHREMHGENESPDDSTALLPKSVLGGKEFKEGDEVVLKIVKDYGDEVEVAYAPEKPAKSSDQEIEEMDTV